MIQQLEFLQQYYLSHFVNPASFTICIRQENKVIQLTRDSMYLTRKAEIGCVALHRTDFL